MWYACVSIVVCIFTFLELGVPEVSAQDVQTVKAQKIDALLADSTAAAYGSPILPNHPPMKDIPPMPMPNSIPDGVRDSGSGIIHDLSTGQTSIGTHSKAFSESTFVTPSQPNASQSDSAKLELNQSSAMVKVNPRDYLRTVKLIVRFDDNGKDRWFQSSGTMRDSQVVITAGHCVYNQDYGWAKEVWAYPAWNGKGLDSLPAYTVDLFGWGYGTKLGAWTGWTEKGDPDADIGYIGLNRAVGVLTTTYDTMVGEDCYELALKTLYNTSYPAEKPCYSGKDMYWWSNTDFYCYSTYLRFKNGGSCNDTLCGGMTGSSARFAGSDNKRYIHAVASTSNSGNAYFCRLWEDLVNWSSDVFIPEVRGNEFDLQPLDLTASPTTIFSGATFRSMTHLAVNPSSTNHNTNVTYNVYLSKDQAIDDSDILLSTQEYTYPYNLFSNKFVVDMVDVSVPHDTPEGDYWLMVAYLPTTDSNPANNYTYGWDAVKVHVQDPITSSLLPLLLLDDDD